MLKIQAVFLFETANSKYPTYEGRDVTPMYLVIQVPIFRRKFVNPSSGNKKKIEEGSRRLQNICRYQRVYTALQTRKQ